MLPPRLQRYSCLIAYLAEELVREAGEAFEEVTGARPDSPSPLSSTAQPTKETPDVDIIGSGAILGQRPQ